MQVQHSIKRAHPGAVITSIEFASNERALLSVSPKWAARVNLIPCKRDWKDWEIYLLLLTMALISVIFFYIFVFEHSYSFWNFPLGRKQPARPPIEAILGNLMIRISREIWWHPKLSMESFFDLIFMLCMFKGRNCSCDRSLTIRFPLY